MRYADGVDLQDAHCDDLDQPFRRISIKRSGRTRLTISLSSDRVGVNMSADWQHRANDRDMGTSC